MAKTIYKHYCEDENCDNYVITENSEAPGDKRCTSNNHEKAKYFSGEKVSYVEFNFVEDKFIHRNHDLSEISECEDCRKLFVHASNEECRYCAKCLN